jgi:hypothetical protein
MLAASSVGGIAASGGSKGSSDPRRQSICPARTLLIVTGKFDRLEHSNALLDLLSRHRNTIAEEMSCGIG